MPDATDLQFHEIRETDVGRLYIFMEPQGLDSAKAF